MTFDDVDVFYVRNQLQVTCQTPLWHLRGLKLIRSKVNTHHFKETALKIYRKKRSKSNLGLLLMGFQGAHKLNPYCK